MRITDALRGEHGVFYAQFDRLDALAGQPADRGAARAMAALLTSALVTHAEIENELLFAAMEGVPDAARGPLAAMRDEHADIEGMLAAAAEEKDPERAGALVGDAVALAREHFAREELMLFPAAEELLDDTVLEELGAAWAARRKVTVGRAYGQRRG